MQIEQIVMVDDFTAVIMVTKKVAEDIEVVYCKETNEGTIFFGDLEIECVYTQNIDDAVSELKEANFLKKLATLQRIERYHKIA